MQDIIFEGKVVIQKNGIYKCPFRCGDSRFPQPKWKTESGFRKHMEVCSMRPSVIVKREKEKSDREENKRTEKAIALANCPYKIGDLVNCVIEIIEKPTHDNRGRRVRYEPVKRYVARTETIKDIDFNGWYLFNGLFSIKDIFSNKTDAQEESVKRQKSWDEHVEFSSLVR